MEKSAAPVFFVDAKNSAAFMKKGGMTYVQFSGTNFCIADSVGAVEASDRKTERRGKEKQTEITYFKMRVDGNICSYFFITQTTVSTIIFLQRSVSKWCILFGL